MQNVQNCLNIKDLEKRLICLQDKYDELKNTLQNERENIITSDEDEDSPVIIEEMEIIKKLIQITKQKIRTVEKSMSKRNGSTIGIGSKISLENHVNCLFFNLVFQNESSPDSGFISVQSPLGKAVYGKRVGEEVKVISPRGEVSYIIKSIG